LQEDSLPTEKPVVGTRFTIVVDTILPIKITVDDFLCFFTKSFCFQDVIERRNENLLAVVFVVFDVVIAIVPEQQLVDADVNIGDVILPIGNLVLDRSYTCLVATGKGDEARCAQELEDLIRSYGESVVDDGIAGISSSSTTTTIINKIVAVVSCLFGS